MFQSTRHSSCRKRGTYFLFLHGAQDNGTRFRFLTTLYSPTFGERSLTVEAEGGVGVMAGWRLLWRCGERRETTAGIPDEVDEQFRSYIAKC